MTYDTITFVNETGNRSADYWEYLTNELAPIQKWDEVIAMDFIDKTSSLMRFFVDFIDDFVFEIDDIIGDLCDYYDDVEQIFEALKLLIFKFATFENWTGFDICGNNFQNAKDIIDVLDNIVEFIELHYQLIEMFFDLYVNGNTN